MVLQLPCHPLLFERPLKKLSCTKVVILWSVGLLSWKGIFLSHVSELPEPAGLPTLAFESSAGHEEELQGRASGGFKRTKEVCDSSRFTASDGAFSKKYYVEEGRAVGEEAAPLTSFRFKTEKQA